MRGRSASRRAFTLVELVGVIIVLSAISLTAIPAMNGIDRARRAADRERVFAALASARRLAPATGTPHGVSFPSGGGRCVSLRWPEGESSPGVTPDAFGNVGDGVALTADPVSTAGGVWASGGSEPAVWFGPSGAPLEGEPDGTDEPAGEAVLVVFASGETIEITPHTGRIAP